MLEIAAEVERLAFSQSLARIAREHAPASEAMRAALAEVLVCTGAERAFVLRRAATGDLETLLAVGPGGRPLGGNAQVSRSVCQHVLAAREALSLVDAQEAGGWQSQESILALGLRTVSAVPIRSGQEPRGVLYVDSGSVLTVFGAREEALLAAAAEVLAPFLA